MTTFSPTGKVNPRGSLPGSETSLHPTHPTDPRIRESTSRPELPTHHAVGMLVFLAYASPVRDFPLISIPGASASVTEIAYLLLPFAFAILPRSSPSNSGSFVALLSRCLLAALALCALLRKLVYGEPVSDVLRDIRPVLPFLSGTIVLALNRRMPGHLLLRYMGIGVLTSLTTMPFLDRLDWLPSSDPSTSLDSASPLIQQGRIYNQNASLMLLGAAALLQSYRIPLIKSIPVVLVSCVALTAGLLTFGRTLLLSTIAAILFITASSPRRRQFVLLAIAVVTIFSAYWVSSALSPEIYEQVENRLSLGILTPERMLDSVYYDNRDVMYQSYLSLYLGHWFLGAPFRLPFSVRELPLGGEIALRITDISVVTMGLKFGTPFALLFLTFWLALTYLAVRALIQRTIPPTTTSVAFAAAATSLPFYLLASTNMDVLARHPSAFTLLMIFATCLPRESTKRTDRSTTLKFKAQ